MRNCTVFVHPAIRPYREDLFRLLTQNLDIQLIFIGSYEHNVQELPKVGLTRWRAYPDRSLLAYREGVNLDVAQIAFSADYRVWISSILHWFPTHVTFPIVKLRKRKFVLWAEDWWWLDDWAATLVRPYIRKIVRSADACLVAGSQARQFFIENGAAPEKVHIAHNATMDLGKRPWDQEQLRIIKTELGFDDRAFVYLYLNRIADYKGLDILLKAFMHVERILPQAWLLIVGAGPLSEEFRAMAKHLGLKRVKFLGHRDQREVHYFYRLAHVYVHPAKFLTGVRVKAEAWGFGVNEAMSMGRPVIATTAVAAAYDLIEDGVSGFMVPAGDDQVLAARMVQVGADPNLAAEMGENARHRMQQFTPYVQFSTFKRVLESL